MEYNITNADITNSANANAIARIDQAVNERNKAQAEVEVLRSALRLFKESIQNDLHEFAESNLTAGESAHEELNTILENNELEGLKRAFTVTVQVTYSFALEVEASNEEDARNDVDNDIYRHLSDHVEVHQYDDIDFEASES